MDRIGNAEFSPLSSSTKVEGILCGAVEFSMDTLISTIDEETNDTSRRKSLRELEKHNRQLLADIQNLNYQVSVNSKTAIIKRLTVLSSEVTANRQLVEGLKDFGPQQGCANRKFDYSNMLTTEHNIRAMLMSLQQKVQTLESQPWVDLHYPLAARATYCVPSTAIDVNKTIVSENIDIRNRFASMKEQIAKLVKELDQERMKVYEEQIQKKEISDELIAIKLVIARETAKRSTKLSLFKRIVVHYIFMLSFNFLILYFTWFLYKLL